MKINGTPYAIGKRAGRHGVIVQRSCTERYTRDYYGVLTAASLYYDTGFSVFYGDNLPFPTF